MSTVTLQASSLRPKGFSAFFFPLAGVGATACAATVVGAEVSTSVKSKSVELHSWAREGTEGSDGNDPATTSGGGMSRELPFF
jgi:hypothetical protein